MRSGFVNDDQRMNVAFTRAKSVFWVLGEKLTIPHRTELPTYVRYKRYLNEQRMVLNMKNSIIGKEGDGWIDELLKKEVSLGSWSGGNTAQPISRVEEQVPDAKPQEVKGEAGLDDEAQGEGEGRSPCPML